MTKAEFICEYYTNIDKCRDFFFNAKWPTGYYCEKCDCTHYYYIKSRGYYRCTKKRNFLRRIIRRTQSELQGCLAITHKMSDYYEKLEFR